MSKYEWGVFIGRMQPPHVGHIDQIQRALDNCDKVVIVFGSSRSAPSPKNPFSVHDREMMVRNSFPQQHSRLEFVSVNDYPYSDEVWLTEVQLKVGQVIGNSGLVALFGCKKDESSYYLDLFPQWKREFGEEGIEIIHSTQIRESFFENKLFGFDSDLQKKLPKATLDFLLVFYITKEYKILRDEYEYYKQYEFLWSKSPFPPFFQTVDMVVVQSGHVLLVERGEAPGKGQYALPGGFVEENERLKDAAVREVLEETDIALPGVGDRHKYLKSHITKEKVFDYPGRSLRGRTITQTYYVKLPGGGPLPGVKGSTDARKAFWISFKDVLQNQDKFFEDHLDIIGYYLGM